MHVSVAPYCDGEGISHPGSGGRKCFLCASPSAGRGRALGPRSSNGRVAVTRMGRSGCRPRTARSAHRGRARACPARRRRRVRCATCVAGVRPAGATSSVERGDRAVDTSCWRRRRDRRSASRRRRGGALHVRVEDQPAARPAARARIARAALRDAQPARAQRRPIGGARPSKRSAPLATHGVMRPATRSRPIATSSHASGCSSKPTPCSQIQRSACWAAPVVADHPAPAVERERAAGKLERRRRSAPRAPGS